MSFVSRRGLFVAMYMVGVYFAEFHSAEAGLLFTEYVKGSSNNKAVEIFNTGNSAVDLSNSVVELYFNGNTTTGASIALSGQIAAQGTYVIAHASATSSLTAVAQRLSGLLSFNGDDAIVLRVEGVIVDSIGQVGVDPGLGWTSNGVSTLDSTLRRQSSIHVGDTNPYDSFDPSVEWVSFPVDTFQGLGTHTVAMANADSDNDGMPDEWELTELGGLDGSPNLDMDGDGRSNLEEYWAGTVPGDPLSVFCMDGVSWDATGFHVSWRGGTNVLQVLEYAPSMLAAQSGQWQSLLSKTSSVAMGQATITNEMGRVGFLRLRAIR